MRVPSIRMVPQNSKTVVLLYNGRTPRLIPTLSRHVSKFAKHTPRFELRPSRHHELRFFVQELGIICLSCTLAKRGCFMLGSRFKQQYSIIQAHETVTIVSLKFANNFPRTERLRVRKEL